MKKNAVITLRVPVPTRRRLEALARREGRSLSQQVERLIERGMAGSESGAEAPSAGTIRPLSGQLRDGPVPSRSDLRAVRTLLSAALVRRPSARGHVRR